jgi:cytochrome c oxidase subunit 2
MTTHALMLAQQLTARQPSALDPHGPAAAEVASLWWAMLAIAAAVFVLVLVLLLLPLFRRRRMPLAEGGPLRDAPPVHATGWVVGGGAIMPAVVLAGVFIASLIVMRDVQPPARASALPIEVIGHRWWWEIRYPGRNVVTADELHLPVGIPAKLRLESADVIHSLWVPQLNGKTDLIPGQTNTMWLQADEPGRYYAKCAEYCGDQHAHMSLMVVAESEGQFNAWLARQRRPALPAGSPASLAGQRVFLEHSCAYCHTIRGTPALGRAGPDLTHVASRSTLAGGAFDNTRGNLAGWIQNPDVLKPGTLMPAVGLSGPDVQAIVAYLEGLR